MKEPSLLDVVAAGGGLSGSALNPQLLWNADSAKGLRERVSGKLGVPVWFFPDGEHELGGCAAGGRAILHINAAGAVEPCPFIHEPGESLNEHSLTDILCSPSLASPSVGGGPSKAESS